MSIVLIQPKKNKTYYVVGLKTRLSRRITGDERLLIPCPWFFRYQVIRTSAKSLAEKAGAAQYAVHIEEELSPEEINSPHELRKRLSNENLFEDSDYEIYQGVVGRPGIDFPVLTGIPQTAFNCRNFGNGYFADLETECQVMSILFNPNSFQGGFS